MANSSRHLFSYHNSDSIAPDYKADKSKDIEREIRDMININIIYRSSDSV